MLSCSLLLACTASLKCPQQQVKMPMTTSLLFLVSAAFRLVRFTPLWKSDAPAQGIFALRRVWHNHLSLDLSIEVTRQSGTRSCGPLLYSLQRQQEAYLYAVSPALSHTLLRPREKNCLMTGPRALPAASNSSMKAVEFTSCTHPCLQLYITAETCCRSGLTRFGAVWTGLCHRNMWGYLLNCCQ